METNYNEVVAVAVKKYNRARNIKKAIFAYSVILIPTLVTMVLCMTIGFIITSDPYARLGVWLISIMISLSVSFIIINIFEPNISNLIKVLKKH